MNKKIYLSSLLVIFYFSSSVVMPQESGGSLDFFSPANRLEFGNYLFCQEDYLRAVSELKEYLKHSNNDTVRFKIAASYFFMGRLNEAIDNYKGLFFNSKLSEEARLEFHKCNFFSNNFENFRRLTQSINYKTEKYSSEIDKLKLASYFLDRSEIPDSTKLKATFTGEQQNRVMDFYMRMKYPKYKDEKLAAGLSALIPGLGKVYLEEVGDGITSFLYTAVFGYLAYSGFENDHKTRAWIFTGLTAYLYASNIYGSIAAAQNYNAGIRFSLDSEIEFYLNKQNYFLPEYDFLCK